jgi:hypothetical protein
MLSPQLHELQCFDAAATAGSFQAAADKLHRTHPTVFACDKRLVSIAGRHLPGGTETIVAARRLDVPHGPTAEQLWQFIGEQAPGGSRSVHCNQPKSFRRTATQKRRL